MLNPLQAAVVLHSTIKTMCVYSQSVIIIVILMFSLQFQLKVTNNAYAYAWISEYCTSILSFCGDDCIAN